MPPQQAFPGGHLLLFLEQGPEVFGSLFVLNSLEYVQASLTIFLQHVWPDNFEDGLGRHLVQLVERVRDFTGLFTV